MAEDGASKLDSFPKEELLKLVKKYVILQKQLKAKNEDLTEKLKLANDKLVAENDLDKQISQLTQANTNLADENVNLKRQIEDFKIEIDELRVNYNKLEENANDVHNNLVAAQQEIDANKTELELLNNELKIVSTEKSYLEKKLLSLRRNNATPVIPEENEEEETEQSENDSQETTSKTKDNERNLEKLTSLTKQIEELSFFVDELKSELEAEKEKNLELKMELDSKQSQIRESVNNIPVTPNENNQSALIELSNQLRDELIIKENFGFYDDNKLTDISLKKALQELSSSMQASIHKREMKINQEKEKSSYIESQLEKLMKEFRAQSNELEISLRNKSEELENYKIQTETKIKSIQSELENEKEKNKTSISKVEKFEKEVSKNKMLDLEISNYERTIKALNVQIITKDKDIGNLKTEVETITQKITKLKEDYDFVEKEKDAAEETITKLKQLLVKVKKEASEAKILEAQQLSMDASMKAQLESANIEIENFKIQLANQAAEFQKLQDKLQQSNETNQRLIHSYESKIKNMQENLTNTQSKFANVQTEYENYKAKVQHVFKKQKEQTEGTVNATFQMETQLLQNEVDQLKQAVLKLKAELDDAHKKIKWSENEYEAIQEEYSNCLDRNTKLMNEMKEKELEWKARNQELLRESAVKSDETFELIRDLKAQNESLSASYKEKIKQINSQHLQSTNILQLSLEESKKEIESLNRELDELHNYPISNTRVNHLAISRNKSASPLTIKEDDAPKTNFILGQSNAQSSDENNLKSSSEGKVKMRTIHQLLSETAQLPVTNEEFEQLVTQLRQIKIELGKAKLQLEHVNELLNESELNNERLNEQISLLKEEIRRLERNQERDKSISNMEYLKNVVLKFLTFSSISEREQLLPVLSTMLKLSQEEQHMILNIKPSSISGMDNNSSWSSYLPKWTA